MNRREFLGTIAAASAFTIVPRRVLGGPRLHPAERHDPARAGRLRHAGAAAGQHRIRPAAGAAVRRGRRSEPRHARTTSTGRISGTATAIRQFLEDPTWCEGDSPAGAAAAAARSRATSWRPTTRNRTGRRRIRAYEDFREMLEKETDIQGIINITPDHQHANINIAALKKGKAAIAHKPVALRALRSAPHAGGEQGERRRARTCWPTATVRTATRSRHGSTAGVIGTVREVHNWTNRPFWPQGWQEYYKSGPPIPDGFNWTL